VSGFFAFLLPKIRLRSFEAILLLAMSKSSRSAYICKQFVIFASRYPILYGKQAFGFQGVQGVCAEEGVNCDEAEFWEKPVVGGDIRKGIRFQVRCASKVFVGPLRNSLLAPLLVLTLEPAPSY